MTTLVWNHTDSPYTVATLSAPGALLSIAEAFGTGSIQWMWDWQAADGSGSATGGPIIEQLGGQLHVIQGDLTRQGLLTAWAISDGVESARIVLMILAEGYGSASDGSVMTAPTPAPDGLTAPYDLREYGEEYGLDESRSDRTLEFGCDWMDDAQEAGHTVTVDIEIDGDISNTDPMSAVGTDTYTVPFYLGNDGTYSIRIRARKDGEITAWSETLSVVKETEWSPPQYRIAWPIAANLTEAAITNDFTFYSGSESVGVDASFFMINGGYHQASADLSPTHYTTTRSDDPPIPFYSVRVVNNPDGESTTETNALNGGAWEPPDETGPTLPIFDPGAAVAEVSLPAAFAGLQLTASASLAHYPAIGPSAIRLQGACGLSLVAAAIRLIVQKALKASAGLRFTASNAAAKAPAGLHAQLREDINPAQPDDPAEYLQVWFNGHPNQSLLTARIDDGPEFMPAFIWQNPGTINPAIIKIPIAGLPGDGSTHVITISVSQRINGQTSPAATVKIQARLPLPKPPQPTFVHARLIRQGTEEIPDLVEVTWTATSGVIISANLRPQGWGYGQDPTKLAGKTVRLGYGNESESRMPFEGIGSSFEFATGSESSVYFSVAAIRHNEVGPPLFTVNPLRIRAYNSEAIEPKTPDEISGSAIHSLHLRQAVYEGLPPAHQQIAAYAYDHALRRIKDIVAKGGNVTVDDFGRFEARWSASRRVKGPAGTYVRENHDTLQRSRNRESSGGGGENHRADVPRISQSDSGEGKGRSSNRLIKW